MLAFGAIKCTSMIQIIMVTYRISCLHSRGYCLPSAAHGIAGLRDESMFRCAIRAYSPSTVTYAIDEQIQKLKVHLNARIQCYQMHSYDCNHNRGALIACSAKHWMRGIPSRAHFNAWGGESRSAPQRNAARPNTKSLSTTTHAIIARL